MSSPRPVVVALLGAPGSGKTTLAAALLEAAGAPPLRTRGPGRLGAGVLEHGGARVALLDAPGSPDAAGDLAAALRGAGAVVLVLSPVQGVDPRTVALWEAAEHLPRVVVLTQLDRPGADADEAVAVCRRVLGGADPDAVVPLTLPLHEDDGQVGGVLDLLSLQVREGGAHRPADAEHVTLVEGLRGELVEAVLTGSEDEELFDRWLDDEEPEPGALVAELSRALAHGDVVPVLVASPRRGVGTGEVLDVFALLPDARTLPVPAVTSRDGAPADLLAGDPDGPLLAEGLRAGLVRVWSGSLAPGRPVLVGDRLLTWPGPAAAAGEVVETPLDVLPGEPVADPGAPLVPAGWDAPPAQFPVGVRPDERLAARVRADAAARLEPDPRTGQLLLWTHGPEHAELLLDGLPSAPVQVPAGGRAPALRVRVPSWAERAVRTDLVARGGEVLRVEPDDGGVVVEATLPAAELVHYALALRRASAATGSFTRLP